MVRHPWRAASTVVAANAGLEAPSTVPFFGTTLPLPDSLRATLVGNMELTMPPSASSHWL